MEQQMVADTERKKEARLRQVAELTTKIGALMNEDMIVPVELEQQTNSSSPKRACVQPQPEPEHNGEGNLPVTHASRNFRVCLAVEFPQRRT